MLDNKVVRAPLVRKGMFCFEIVSAQVEIGSSIFFSFEFNPKKKLTKRKKRKLKVVLD
jgi:hypothetical protein